jgi:hypothetical protein
MDPQTKVLIVGIASAIFGLLLLTNDPLVAFISRTVKGYEKNKERNRRFQGWMGIIVGGVLIAMWLLK